MTFKELHLNLLPRGCAERMILNKTCLGELLSWTLELPEGGQHINPAGIAGPWGRERTSHCHRELG